jgi:hypothetical protein
MKVGDLIRIRVQSGIPIGLVVGMPLPNVAYIFLVSNGIFEWRNICDIQPL